jgi:hypothetical protein
VQETGETKPFVFDYSYWSHDGYIEPTTEGGYLHPYKGSRYDDQNKVYNDLVSPRCSLIRWQGKEVLDNAFEGFNACLFAYGQTGSGKSYSIVGYGENKGIIPRVCDEIFFRIRQREDLPGNRVQHEVKLAMLQVYNEKVQDLLIKKTAKPKEDLAIREDPNRGVYVQDLTEVPVSSYEEIDT